MIWKGDELRAPMHYVDAMRAIRDPDDAAEFLVTWRKENPTADRDAGYLTGYMAEQEGERVRRLFGIEHPVIGDLERPLTFHELLQLGMSFAHAQIRGLDFEQAAARARDDVRALRRVREETNGPRPATD